MYWIHTPSPVFVYMFVLSMQLSSYVEECGVEHPMQKSQYGRSPENLSPVHENFPPFLAAMNSSSSDILTQFVPSYITFFTCFCLRLWTHFSFNHVLWHLAFSKALSWKFFSLRIFQLKTALLVGFSFFCMLSIFPKIFQYLLYNFAILWHVLYKF